jgi:hypothetical protein
MNWNSPVPRPMLAHSQPTALEGWRATIAAPTSPKGRNAKRAATSIPRSNRWLLQETRRKPAPTGSTLNTRIAQATQARVRAFTSTFLDLTLNDAQRSSSSFLAAYELDHTISRHRPEIVTNDLSAPNERFCEWQTSFGCRSAGAAAAEVAASDPPEGFRSQSAFQLHQAPDPGAVGADVRLDLGGRRTDGGQVDAKQLRAPLQRRRDRPVQIRVVPSPHRTRLSNACSIAHRQRCVVRRTAQSLSGPRWGRNLAEPGDRRESRT